MNNEIVIKLDKDKLKSKTSFNIKIGSKNYVLLEKNKYIDMKNSLDKNYKELIQNMLEKEIIKEIPKDFEDVYIVAKNMIDNMAKGKKVITIYDIRKTIKELKVNYPNLFVDLEQYYQAIKPRLND